MTMHEHPITYMMVSVKILAYESCQRIAMAQYEVNGCPSLKSLQFFSNRIRKRQFVWDMAKSSQEIKVARVNQQTF